MSGFRSWALIIGVSLVVVYAVGSGYWVQTSGAWYSSLRRPSWQPPDVVFGLIWPYNFVMLGVAAYVVASRLDRAATATFLLFLAVSVGSALIWSQQFYGPHRLAAASVALAIAALSNLPVLAMAWRASTLVGGLLLPYQIWLCIAATLSAGYAHLNR